MSLQTAQSDDVRLTVTPTAINTGDLRPIPSLHETPRHSKTSRWRECFIEQAVVQVHDRRQVIANKPQLTPASGNESRTVEIVP